MRVTFLLNLNTYILNPFPSNLRLIDIKCQFYLNGILRKDRGDFTGMTLLSNSEVISWRTSVPQNLHSLGISQKAFHPPAMVVCNPPCVQMW